MKTSEILESTIYVDLEKAHATRQFRDNVIDQIRKSWISKTFFIRDPKGEISQKDIESWLGSALYPSQGMGYVREKTAVVNARNRFIKRELKVSTQKGKGKDGTTAWKVTVSHTIDGARTRVNEMAEEARNWARANAKPRKWKHTSHIADDDLRDAYKVIDTLSPEAQRELRLRMGK